MDLAVICRDEKIKKEALACASADFELDYYSAVDMGEMRELVKKEMPPAMIIDLGMKGAKEFVSEVRGMTDAVMLGVYLAEKELVPDFPSGLDRIIKIPASREEARLCRVRLRDMRKSISDIKIELKMLGRFDVFFESQALHFKNAKAKELLALCADRMGGIVTMEEAVDKLWENKPYDQSTKSLYRKAVCFLRNEFSDLGCGDVFITRRGSCCIDIKKVKCDYYDCIRSGVGAKPDNYLFDYSWAEGKMARMSHGEREI